jgi:hypothetical protein
MRGKFKRSAPSRGWAMRDLVRSIVYPEHLALGAMALVCVGLVFGVLH